MEQKRNLVPMDDFALTSQKIGVKEQKKVTKRGVILRTPHDCQSKQLELHLFATPRNLIQVSKKLNQKIARRVRDKYWRILDGLTPDVFRLVNEEMGSHFFMNNDRLIANLEIHAIDIQEKDAIVSFSLEFDFGEHKKNGRSATKFLSKMLEKVTCMVMSESCIRASSLHLEVRLKEGCCEIETTFFDHGGMYSGAARKLYVDRSELENVKKSGGDCLVIEGEVVELPKATKFRRVPASGGDGFAKSESFVLVSYTHGREGLLFPLSIREHGDLVTSLSACRGL